MLVIFDCDGVLVDSERLAVRVEAGLITGLGWPLTEADVLERFVGRSDAYMLGQLGNSLPLPGGVGGVEPVMLGVITSSGVDLGLGAAAVVLYRFVSLGVQSVAGAVAISTLIPALQRDRRGQAGHL